MIIPQLEPFAGPERQRLRLLREGAPMSWVQCLHGWAEQADFRDTFSAALADSAFGALRWECPPLCAAGLDEPFECMLIDAPELDRPADGQAFVAPITAAGEDAVVRFANLGGEAELVVPRRLAASRVYPHLAAFLRAAPRAQRHALWRTVAEAVKARLAAGGAPLWLNTAGEGVAWLHVRLDAHPKYYRHAPYRRAVA